MKQNEITVFQQSIETCEDPAEIARKVKLAFKRMPGEMALACFAQVMTAELPHQIKVALFAHLVGRGRGTARAGDG